MKDHIGDWSESCSNYFDKICPTSEYPDVVSEEEIKSGEVCFVVWAEYSTGDSFGHSSRGSTEALGVFKSSEIAMELRDILKEAKDYMVETTLSNGQKMKIHIPWNGYFESLDVIHIETVVMNVPRKF